MRTALTAGAHAPHLVAHEPQLGHVVELADVAGHLEEGVEARRARAGRSCSGASRSSGRGSRPGSRSARSPRARAARARRAPAAPRRRARARGRAGRPTTGSGAAQTANTIGSPVRSSQSRPRSWCGVGILERALERRVADQQLRVRASSPSGTMLRLRQQHAREHDRGRALRRHGDRAHAAERQPRDELDRVDGALRRDAQPRQQAQPVRVARVLDRRDRRDVDLAVDQHPVQLRRDAGDLLDVVLEPVEDRRHVDVARCGRAGSR